MKTCKRDYVIGAELRDAETVLAQLGGWFDDCNTRAPHSALEMRSPAEYRAEVTLSLPGVQNREHSTNLLERLFLEERRRTKVIPHTFGKRPVLKLMYAAVIRAADRWPGLTVGKFEQRQLRAIREELNRAHAERTRQAVRSVTRGLARGP